MKRLLAVVLAASVLSVVPGERAFAAVDPAVQGRHTLPLSADQMDEYVGTYANPTLGMTYLIARKGAELDAQIVGQNALAIYASRPDHFFYTKVAAYIEFVRDGGKVVGLVLTQNRVTYALPKLSANGAPLVSDVVPDYPSDVELDAQTLDSYAGSYTRDPYSGTVLTVRLRNGHVFARIEGQQAFEIYPSAKDTFYYKVVDALVQFHRNARGEVTSLTLNQNGVDREYYRKH